MGFVDGTMKNYKKLLMSILFTVILILNGCEPPELNDSTGKELASKLFRSADCSYYNVRIIKNSTIIDKEIRQILVYNDNSPCINSKTFKRMNLESNKIICISFEINVTDKDFLKDEDNLVFIKPEICDYDVINGLKIKEVETNGIKFSLE